MGEEKKYKVLTPVKDFTGYRYGVFFKDGVGYATKHQAQVLVGNWGYSCPELEAEKKASKSESKNEEQPAKEAEQSEQPAQETAKDEKQKNKKKK